MMKNSDCEKKEKFLKWLHGPSGGSSTRRPAIVADFADTLEDNQGELFWAVVSIEWSTFDAIDHDKYFEHFQRFANTAPAQQVSYDQNEITIYRGQNLADWLGLAWTTEWEVARGFARGHRNVRVPEPAIYRAICPMSLVAFFNDERHESEVVILDWDLSDHTSHIEAYSLVTIDL